MLHCRYIYIYVVLFQDIAQGGSKLMSSVNIWGGGGGGHVLLQGGASQFSRSSLAP